MPAVGVPALNFMPLHDSKGARHSPRSGHIAGGSFSPRQDSGRMQNRGSSSYHKFEPLSEKRGDEKVTTRVTRVVRTRTFEVHATGMRAHARAHARMHACTRPPQVSLSDCATSA